METVRRVCEPKDRSEFGPKSPDKLNAAAQELRFLLNRGYDVKSASTFIGSHHLLSQRPRMAHGGPLGNGFPALFPLPPAEKW